MEPIALEPGEGRTLMVLGVALTFKAIGAQTHEAYSLVEARAEPGGVGPLAHTHTDREELFHVVEGEIEFLVGEEWGVPKPAGAVLLVPRGIVHTFRNGGASPARLLILHSPAMDRYFLELHDLLSSGAPDPAAVVALMRAYGMEVPGA